MFNNSLTVHNLDLAGVGGAGDAQPQQPTIFNLACIECQYAMPVQPVPMMCCLRMMCKPCIKRKAKELLTMPLKKKQQLMQQQAAKFGGQVPKELLYECPHCSQMHPIKEMLRWPVNLVVDAYIKEIGTTQQNNEINDKEMQAQEKQIANELGEDDSPFNKDTCERCEKAKTKLICFDCGALGTALCEPCSQVIHACGSFSKHKIVSSDKKPVGGMGAYAYPGFEDDSKSMNSFICREHANADFEKFCFTCHQLMCMKCVNQHPQKHAVRNLKEAAEEVMSQYKNTLDKINGTRDKTDFNITRIKSLMTKAEADTQKVEATIRGRCQLARQLIDSKEKEMITSVHLQKQKVLNHLVMDKIELEDFKLREYFPLKLFEILEDKLYRSQELPVVSLLAQTRYFKKLLDQTQTLRRQTSATAARMRDADDQNQDYNLSLTTDLVESRMQELNTVIDRHVQQMLSDSQQAKPPVQILPESSQVPEESENFKESLIHSQISNPPGRNLTLDQDNLILQKSGERNIQGAITLSDLTPQNLNNKSGTMTTKSNNPAVQKKMILLTQKEEGPAPTQHQQPRHQATASMSKLNNNGGGGGTTKNAATTRHEIGAANESTLNNKTTKTKRENSKMMRQSASEERSGEALLSQSLVNKAQLSQTQTQLNPMQILLKKRVFTKTECSSTSIKLQWEHINKDNQQYSFGAQQVQYLLEYGIGVKVSGVEQFRQVYQGKAHRCIITDLNPRTNYRIRVAAGIPNAENARDLTEVGEWSEIISVTTLDNQRISEYTIDDESVSPFYHMPENASLAESSFISNYSSINPGQSPGNKINDSYIFHKPAFVYGHHEWTFGKHFFQIDSSLLEKGLQSQERSPSRIKEEINQTTPSQDYSCFLTIGLICTTLTPQNGKEEKKQPKSANPNSSTRKEDERVIVGCKVSIKKESTMAQVQVYINIEKHLMLCIANGKVKERFDLSQYDSFLPVVKYDGDAHKHLKVITALQFDMSVPAHIEQTANELFQESQLQQKAHQITLQNQSSQSAAAAAATTQANPLSPSMGAQKLTRATTNVNQGKRNQGGAQQMQTGKSQGAATNQFL